MKKHNATFLSLLGLMVTAHSFAKAIDFEHDPAIVAKVVSNADVKLEGEYARKDVSRKQAHLRENLQVIQYTRTYHIGPFDHGFAEISNLHTTTKLNSPLLKNSDGSQTAHLYKDAQIVSLAYDGTLLFPVWDSSMSGEAKCLLAKNSTTLYCNGVSKFSRAQHDYEGADSSIGQITHDKKQH